MRTKNHPASILVVTMMIMGIILVSALSISLVSIQERKASMGANKSNQAYQIADTGIETVMDDIINGDNDQVSDLAGCRPADGLIHNDATGYTVELKDADENKIACNSATDIAEVVHIKSVGTASGQAQRSIEAAVAAGSGELEGYCVMSDGNRNPRKCGGDVTSGTLSADGITGSPISPAKCDASSNCACESGYTRVFTGGCGWGSCADNEAVYAFSCAKK